jgi:hypothetical protein
MVTCSSNLPRVESDGTALGVLAESASTNNLLRSEELENAAWVSTATVTANQATDTFNNVAADQLSDVSGAALQGSAQTFVTGSLTKQSVFCIVRAGTATSATIAMTGTGNAAGDCSATVSGLSGSTYNILTCSSASAYAAGLTAVTLTISVGTVVGDTGTIMVGGCQHELNPFPTSYIPTVAAAATRSGDATALNGQTYGFPSGSMSVAGYVTPEFNQSDIVGGESVLEGQIGTASGAGFFFVSGAIRCQVLNAGSTLVNGTPAPAVVKLVTHRWGCTNQGGSTTVYEDGAIIGGPTVTTTLAGPWSTTTGVAYSPAFPKALNGILSRLCLDSSTRKCPP